MKEILADSFVDITDVDCPITFVKVQVAIEKIQDGQTLEIKMNCSQPLEHVPHTLLCEGHEILRSTDNRDGTFTVLIKKASLDS